MHKFIEPRQLQEWFLRSTIRGRRFVADPALFSDTVVTPTGIQQEPADVKLPKVERVRQEDPLRWCAPASIQMILKNFDIDKSQADIWSESRQYMVEPRIWYTDPQAVCSYLQNTPGIGSIDLTRNADFVYSLSKLTREIDKSKFPPAMLVNGGRHWVVACGVSVAFSGVDRENGKIYGVWVADPSRGVDGIKFHPLTPNFANETFRPVELNSQWNGLRVSVGTSGSDIVDNLTPVEPSRPMGGGGDGLTGDEALALAIEDIQHYGLGRAEKILGGGGLSGTTIEIGIVGTTRTYFIVPTALNDRDIVWSIFDPQELSITSTLFADSVPLPPSGDQLRILARARGYRKIAEGSGLLWADCMELASRYDVVREVFLDDVKMYVTSDGLFLEMLHKTLEI